jgi:hypothetical protein
MIPGVVETGLFIEMVDKGILVLPFTFVSLIYFAYNLIGSKTAYIGLEDGTVKTIDCPRNGEAKL